MKTLSLYVMAILFAFCLVVFLGCRPQSSKNSRSTVTLADTSEPTSPASSVSTPDNGQFKRIPASGQFYENKEYGFSMTVPGGWVAEQDLPPEMFQQVTFDNTKICFFYQPDCQAALAISTHGSEKKPKGLTLDKWMDMELAYDQENQPLKEIRRDKINLGGHAAIKSIAEDLKDTQCKGTLILTTDTRDRGLIIVLTADKAKFEEANLETDRLLRSFKFDH